MENKLSHFDENGNAVMVDVSDKPVTHRTAVATGSIQVGAEIMERLTEGTVAKGANVSPPSRHQMHRGF